MTDLRKAAEMALEALVNFGQGNSDPAKALRQALDYPTPEQIALAQQIRPKGKSRIGQALAKLEQEPVCFIRETDWSYEIAPWDDPKGFPVYTAPQQRNCDNCESLRRAAWDRINELEDKLKEREWIELTDEEIWKCYNHADFKNQCRAVEAKLKEKNQ